MRAMEGASQPLYRTMRELAEDERPRERLLAHGPEVLADAELVAVILGSGTRGENVVDLSRRLLEALGGITGLARADGAALQRTRGLGPAGAARIVAAMELGRRLPQATIESRPRLTSPEAVYALVGPRLLGLSKERLVVVSLDTKARLLGAPTDVPGGVANVSVRAAEVFRQPVVLEASSVILVHNHPSGDPAPSPQDVLVTKGLVAAGELLGIEVLDHLVTGQNCYVSMKRDGYGFAQAKSRTPGSPSPG
jgi:DNA repair protein RadC